MNWTKAFFLIIFECFCIINIEISAGSILVPLNSIKIMEEMPIGTVVANLADNHRLIDLVTNDICYKCQIRLDISFEIIF